jgi:hypothetical protein
MNPNYEIRFNSLFRGHGLCFPCDEKGQVELDALSDRARENYLYARAVVGVEFAYPTVCPHITAAGSFRLGRPFRRCPGRDRSNWSQGSPVGIRA